MSITNLEEWNQCYATTVNSFSDIGSVFANKFVYSTLLPYPEHLLVLINLYKKTTLLSEHNKIDWRQVRK